MHAAYNLSDDALLVAAEIAVAAWEHVVDGISDPSDGVRDSFERAFGDIGEAQLARDRRQIAKS